MLEISSIMNKRIVAGIDGGLIIKRISTRLMD